MSNPNGLEPALEKGTYSAFRQTMVSSLRQSNIGSKLITLDKTQLPNNSVLHMVDKLLALQVDSVLPDLTAPLIHNEKLQVYLYNMLDLPSGNVRFPIDDTYRFRPSQFSQELRQFWIKNRTIKKPASFSAAITRSNSLPLINYNPLLTMLVTGQFFQYRKFDIILRTILDTLLQVEDKNQYLEIPLSRTVYRKVQFVQTFDAINYKTVRIKQDPSFFFLIHLINFVAKSATTSYFSQVPREALDTINIILTAGKQAVIYNLGDLATLRDARTDDTFYQQVLRHINTLKLFGHADVNITELDDHAYDKLVEEVAPDDDHVETDAITPPLADAVVLPTSVTPKAATALPSDKHISPVTVESTVKSSKDTGHSDNHLTPSTPLVHNPPAEDNPDKVAANSNPESTPPLTTPAKLVVEPLPQSSHSLLAVIDHGAQQAIHAATHLTEAQRDVALRAAQIYKTLKIDGVSISERLEQTAEPAIQSSSLEFLKDSIPDQSMLHSTAIDLDRHYIEHIMAKDLAAVVAQMAVNGMFLVQVDQRDEVTQLDRIRHYKTVYQDLNGRRHTLTFKFPIVSADGTFIINGIENRMIKQQVNLPICKISANRVSLASSYNKTIVERIDTKAHNFSAYITKYIISVARAKVGLTLSYGGLNSKTKLPYDYSSLARRFSLITITLADQYQFTFDYEHRFGRDLPPPYTEAEGTVTHAGGLYDLPGLLTETNALPTQQFSIDDLKWILPYDTTDADRLKNADITAPILVTIDKQGRMVTIDGFHRLTKAVSEGLTTLPGKLVPEDMLLRHRIGDATETVKISDFQHRVTMLHGLEKDYGVYCGTAQLAGIEYAMFFGVDNQLRFVDCSQSKFTEATQYTISFISLLFGMFEEFVPAPKALSEWTELKILDKNFPLVFILGFEYGLQRVLDHVKLTYQFIPYGTRIKRDATTLVIPFADGNLVFDRYPLSKSFIVAGLLKFDTKPYEFAKFNTQDIYYTLLQDSGISLNYLKGISDFFKLFIDPITRDVLLRMGEPTDVGRLLLRASEMLLTEDAKPSASMSNHRIRGYERFTTTLYNEMARSYATFSRQRGNRKSYSINPEAVFLRLIQDQTLHIVEEINPVENVKDKHSATYTGSGGRTAQSFVVEDRQFPEDGTGILSEATPDNGKVAMNTYISANPRLANIRGMFDPEPVDPKTLEPSQILSITSLLMPGTTNDD